MKLDFELAVVSAAAGAAVAILVIMIVLVDKQVNKRANEYKAACTAVGGKPVYDGWRWECLK